MGRLMCEEGLVPERIISSTAQRARTTTELVVQSGGFCGEIVFTGDLYHAPPQRVVVVLRAVPDDVASVLVVGHNPGLEELLDLLTGAGLPMPTAALAQVELPIRSWRDLQVTTKGSLVNFWRPRELAELA